MKFTCLQENLKISLNISQNIIGRNLTLPILNNLLLKTEGSRLKISATNLEIGINTWTSGKVEKSGVITCPAKILSSFVNNLPNKKIEIELKDLTLNIKCENYKASIKGLSADDFPIIPNLKESFLTELPSDILKEGLSQVVGSAAYSELRPEISGVLFQFEKNSLKLVATDSFRLAERKIFDIKTESEALRSFILPQRTAQELIRILGEKPSAVKIISDGSQVLFELNETQLVSRLVDGQYPDYQQIIPKNFSIQLAAEKEELINTIRIAGLFSSKINDIKFSLQNNKFFILSQDFDLGENKTQLDAEVKGKDVTVVFNYRYLLEGLGNMNSKKITIGLNSDSAPAVFRPADDGSYLYVVMPIKTN